MSSQNARIESLIDSMEIVFEVFVTIFVSSEVITFV